MIESKKYACPECESYGHIIVRDGKLECGNCENRYTENQAIDLTGGNE